MPPAHQADADLDALIDEITVDAHDEDEQLMGVENAFDRTPASHATPPSSAKKSRCSPSAEPATATS